MVDDYGIVVYLPMVDCCIHMTYPHTPHSITINMYCMHPACLPLTPLIVVYHIAIPPPQCSCTITRHRTLLYILHTHCTSLTPQSLSMHLLICCYRKYYNATPSILTHLRFTHTNNILLHQFIAIISILYHRQIRPVGANCRHHHAIYCCFIKSPGDCGECLLLIVECMMSIHPCSYIRAVCRL